MPDVPGDLKENDVEHDAAAGAAAPSSTPAESATESFGEVAEPDVAPIGGAGEPPRLGRISGEEGGEMLTFGACALPFVTEVDDLDF